MEIGARNKSLFETLLEYTVYAIVTMSVFIAIVALFSKDIGEEASIGSFGAEDFNQNWILEEADGTETEIQLPYSQNTKDGEVLTVHNILPANISDESGFILRANVEDVYVYIDGKLRQEYSTESMSYMSYYLPSAYVVTTLSEEDSQKEIVLKVRTKAYGVISEVRIGPGNNVWFSIIKQSLPVSVAALMILISGAILLILAVLYSKLRVNQKLVYCLSLLMIDVAVWMFSESLLRQLIFAKPSMSQYFSYISMEIIGVLACMYFDEVQHKKYHKLYFAAEFLGTAVVITNFALHFTGIIEVYKTMFAAHIVMIISLLLAIGTIINDIRTGAIKEYKAVAIGMGIMLAASGIEIIAFYIYEFHVFGVFACVGLIIMMISTVIQILLDWIKETRARELEKDRATVDTIKTIAGTIDAKDEYTGGHSERVGLYASTLARAMAADYDFSEEDIERIKYIGTMHDIGKIGIPDRVLNKNGRLDDEEYEIMKKHVEIGSNIMEGLDSTIKDLKDGIRYHHERFDGKGYPEGLKETEIPLVARIICLADCYDAMTSDRVYRKRLADEQVRNEIQRCAGTQFDPALAEIFIRLIDEGEL